MIWTSQLLSSYPEIKHGCTSREFGLNSFGYTGDDEVIKSRRKIAKQLGFKLDDAVILNQQHTNKVAP